jgi:hypothetical protein
MSANNEINKIPNTSMHVIPVARANVFDSTKAIELDTR